MLLFKIIYSRIAQQEIDMLYNLFDNYLNIDECERVVETSLCHINRAYNVQCADNKSNQMK